VTPQKVIHSYRAIAGLYTLSASLIWGVNTLFLLDAGLDILGVFIANATPSRPDANIAQGAGKYDDNAQQE